MKYEPTWDLRTIPDPQFFEELRTRPDAPLYSEVSRRRSSQGGGRPKVMKTCAKCGAVMSAREMRAHKCGKKGHG